MKKIQLIKDVVMAAAILVLFFLYFASGKKNISDNADGQKNDSTNLASVVSDIAYLDIDSLINKYDYYFELKNQFEAKQKKLEADFQARQDNLNRRGQDLQNKMAKHLILQSEAEKIYLQLQQEGAELQQYGQQLTMQLAEEEQVMRNKLINEIVEYLKVFNKNQQYNYILGTNYGGSVLYGAPSADITKQVIEGLNEQYKKTLEEQKSNE